MRTHIANVNPVAQAFFPVPPAVAHTEGPKQECLCRLKVAKRDLKSGISVVDWDK